MESDVGLDCSAVWVIFKERVQSKCLLGSLLKCYKSFCWMMHKTMKKHSFCSGRTFFWSRISINRPSHLSMSADPLKRASHLACLFWVWWKCMKKMFLDNLAALSTVPYICQRACFYIKGAAVSLQELTVMADDEMNELRCDQSPSFWRSPVRLKSLH